MSSIVTVHFVVYLFKVVSFPLTTHYVMIRQSLSVFSFKNLYLISFQQKSLIHFVAGYKEWESSGVVVKSALSGK